MSTQGTSFGTWSAHYSRSDTTRKLADQLPRGVSLARDSVTNMMARQITLGAINLEAQDPTALARFWASVTGATPSPGGDSVYLPPASPEGFAMFFQPMTGPRPEHQAAHLDLTVPWGMRQAEVERLVGLGATYQWDVLDEFPHVQWTTLADPEGNLFCLAEHPPAEQQSRESRS